MFIHLVYKFRRYLNIMLNDRDMLFISNCTSYLNISIDPLTFYDMLEEYVNYQH